MSFVIEIHIVLYIHHNREGFKMIQRENIARDVREIEWDDAFSVNVSEIDEEHKKLIKIINKVINISNQEDARDEIAIVLYEMTNYALNHFKTEENYMRKSKYANYQLHKDEHNDFIKNTVDFGSRTMNSGHDITGDLLEYLQSWLVSHIQGTDKEFFSYFHRNGPREYQREVSVSC